MPSRRAAAAALALAAIVATLASAPPRAGAQADVQPEYPGIRAAFYYPWFPGAWDQEGVYPFTKYTPSLGYYDSGDEQVIARHIEMMRHGRIDAAIASWWGPSTDTDRVIPKLLDAARATPFRWALYHEGEGYGDPSPEQIEADLRYMAERYTGHEAYLRVAGRPVVFVYNDPDDGCDVAERWAAANTVGAWLVLKIAPGWENCRGLADDWHQYAPGVSFIHKRGEFITLSPGFDRVHEPSPRLPRDLDRWHRDIRGMVATAPPWELITSFNEWGEGTSVEEAEEWGDAYLTALRHDGQQIFPATARLAGADRYETAAALSRALAPGGAGTVVLASGLSFPDALAGGPAAAASQAPLLLTDPSRLPDATRVELERLAPTTVVILGGSHAVSEGVRDAVLATGVGDVVRVAGEDRYATAAAVARRAFPEGSPAVFVVNGSAFADGLVAGSAGASRSSPVLLVARDHAPEHTLAELRRLRPERVFVVGGQEVVSDAVAEQLHASVGVAVERLAGPDRYATAVAVSAATRAGGGDAILATGEAFPDALAAGATGRSHALVLTRPTCVPDWVYDELRRINPPTLTVLGGTRAVSDSAAALRACPR